jgi:hypothetical protein
LLPDQANRDLVAAVEENPTGTIDDLLAAGVASSRREDELRDDEGYWTVKHLGRSFYKSTPQGAAELVADSVADRVGETDDFAFAAERESQAHLLRDIMGNPLHPLPPRPESIGPLAEQIYQDRWDLMPLLGEWLQEHGYWSEGEHCLDPNVHHVKGCWVVDWVTGRR